MIKDINGNNAINNSASRTSKSTNRAEISTNTSSAETKGSGKGSDKVSLSAEAQLLGQVKGIVASLPDVDMARVQQFKTAIANGEYQVDNHSVAEKILNSDNS